MSFAYLDKCLFSCTYYSSTNLANLRLGAMNRALMARPLRRYPSSNTRQIDTSVVVCFFIQTKGCLGLHGKRQVSPTWRGPATHTLLSRRKTNNKRKKYSVTTTDEAKIYIYFYTLLSNLSGHDRSGF